MIQLSTPLLTKQTESKQKNSAKINPYQDKSEIQDISRQLLPNIPRPLLGFKANISFKSSSDSEPPESKANPYVIELVEKSEGKKEIKNIVIALLEPGVMDAVEDSMLHKTTPKDPKISKLTEKLEDPETSQAVYKQIRAALAEESDKYLIMLDAQEKFQQNSILEQKLPINSLNCKDNKDFQSSVNTKNTKIRFGMITVAIATGISLIREGIRALTQAGQEGVTNGANRLEKLTESEKAQITPSAIRSTSQKTVIPLIDYTGTDKLFKETGKYIALALNTDPFDTEKFMDLMDAAKFRPGDCNDLDDMVIDLVKVESRTPKPSEAITQKDIFRDIKLVEVSNKIQRMLDSKQAHI